MSPDPIGPVAEREEAWRAFRRYVDDHGWALGVLGAGEEWLPIYRATGMHDLYVGDEAVVRLRPLHPRGRPVQGAAPGGQPGRQVRLPITFHDPAHLDPDLRSRSSTSVMTKSRRGDVERGFSMTLGRVFDPDDAGLLLAWHGRCHTSPDALDRRWPSASTCRRRASAATRSTSCAATTATIPTG